MIIIDQHTKKIMEECKLRAKDHGLSFTDESIEYLVTNQDLLELGPKGMIPTLYDYWVHDLQVIKSKKEYELFPHNPYETVINSRPPLSFYNDNNPDWLNVMIFYHVIAHIDFMQNNSFFEHTWGDDFVGMALADNRLVASLRTEHGRWVDYVIEFTRGLDNIIGFHRLLGAMNLPHQETLSKIDYFFDIFLQKVKDVDTPVYLKEIERYNKVKKESGKQAVSTFLSTVKTQYPEFEALYEKYCEDYRPPATDVLEFIMENSAFLNKDENEWMKSVMQIVRNTALYFAPQMRTKVMNEGWASFWHEELFLCDDRIEGHEADFAKVNAMVTSVPKVGFNPYAIGLRLFKYVEDSANKGRFCYEFELLKDVDARRKYDRKTGEGRDYIFKLREEFCDFTFLNTFIDQDFVDRFNLVIIGERINQQRMTREYYIKSKKAGDYKQMLIDNLIHPPHVSVDTKATDDGKLVLVHEFEGKQLVPEFIENVMLGTEYLWGGEVELHTNLVTKDSIEPVVYKMKDRKLEKNVSKK